MSHVASVPCLRSTAKARDYLELTKPGITLFIGVSAVAGFITADRSIANPAALLLMLVATMAMSAGAATLNQVIERAADARMRRTGQRPLPSGRVSVQNARLLGWLLSACGVSLSLATLPWATTLFLVLSHISYLHVYTPLKRRTPLCTLAGAIPGALPVLAGWSASGQPIDSAAIALTGVLFTWQIPHFMAIGWLAREDYARAGFRMLCVVDATGRLSARVSVVYAAVMLVCAVAIAISASTGPLYLLASCALGATYTWRAQQLLRNRDAAHARRLFLTSLWVLPALLAALGVDLVVFR